MNDQVLITGFEPFGGDVVNPSWEVARTLDGRRIAGRRIVARRLPCAFRTALPLLFDALDGLKPRCVIALGLAGSRSAVSIERVAINIVDARIPDNLGAQPVDEPVQAEAPAAFFSSLPIKAISAGLREAGLPAEVSQSAGTFVCNQVFFGLMQHLQATPGIRGGFIHLPPLPEQAARHPGARPLSLVQQVQAIELAVAITLTRATDLRLAAGTID
ncbi:pyroglutamyl-peptidase I [Aquincola sp. S2]|uniref:Pyrrolidone-carboxylate peptidase n=1 Tax=Pseudaquabacterium terrae TaxID=2732868 RepID=A0ABX2EQ44_9BURK|nr:pyroglutamyl-peptidase I [Aquabacterium terrae]NRF70660.1 pyroglutamyl-peptidase I [Aquabacterium terrae]